MGGGGEGRYSIGSWVVGGGVLVGSWFRPQRVLGVSLSVPSLFPGSFLGFFFWGYIIRSNGGQWLDDIYFAGVLRVLVGE